MKIAKVSFSGIRGVADATFDLVNPSTGEPHSLVVVTGPAAGGKTRLLEALIVAKEIMASYGGVVPTAGWVRDDEAAKISIDWHLDPLERTFAGHEAPIATTEALFLGDGTRAEIDEGVQTLLERYEHEHDKGKIEYFPVNRCIPRYGGAHGLEAIHQRLLRPTSDERKYAFVPRFLESLRRDPGRAEYFGALLGYLSSTVRLATETSPDRPFAVLTSTDGHLAETHELSSSEVEAVIFAATATLLGLSKSVVLVDRPELHAQPENVSKLVQALCSLGRDNQVIVATGSHEVVASVDPSQVVRVGRPR
jgi:energy-coupling factor transporter ATP-binding protein EcfA2